MAKKGYTRKRLSQYAGKLIAGRFGGARITKIKMLGYGSFGTVYRIDIDKEPCSVALKVFKLKGQYVNEVAALDKLRPFSSIAMPTVYLTQVASDEFPNDVILMQMMPGRNVFLGYLLRRVPKTKRDLFAMETIRCLEGIHSQKSPSFGPFKNPQYSSWMEYYQPKASKIRIEIMKKYEEGKVKKDLVMLMERAWSHFDEIFSEPVKVRWSWWLTAVLPV